MAIRHLVALGLVVVVASAGVAGCAPNESAGRSATPAVSPPSSGTANPASAQPVSPGPGGWSPPPVPTVAGRDVYSVSRAIEERDAGKLDAKTVALGAYWSYAGIAWSCPLAGHDPIDLEGFCLDGLFGLTDSYETVTNVITNGNSTSWSATKDPYLTPYFPADLQPTLYSAPRQTPVPIVVLGHFHDPRAANCAAEARQRCLDRFVIESVLVFGPAAASSPTP